LRTKATNRGNFDHCNKYEGLTVAITGAEEKGRS
jgi:hypothetical protein